MKQYYNYYHTHLLLFVTFLLSLLLSARRAEAWVQQPPVPLQPALTCSVSSRWYYHSPRIMKNMNVMVLKNNVHDTCAAMEYNDFLPGPNPSYNAVDVVTACMNTLLCYSDKKAGLEVCFHFSSDRCRAALGGSLEKFTEYATNPVFGLLVNCVSWDIVSIGPIIAGTNTRGAMQTILINAQQPVVPEKESTNDENNEIEGNRRRRRLAQQQTNQPPHNDDGSRRFLWTLQQERRPPYQGCWMVHEVIYVKNAYALTL